MDYVRLIYRAYKMKFLSLCDGMAGGYLALNNLGFNFNDGTNEYHAVENDRFARNLADANLKGIIRHEHDVTKITRAWVKKHGPFDFVGFGSPCQSLSNLGDRKGLEGKSRIFLDCFRVLQWARAFNPEVKYLIENVKMQARFKKTFDDYIGTQGILVNSNLMSAQNRERYYWTNLPVELPKRELGLQVANILEGGGLDTFVLNYSSSTRYVDKQTGKVFSSPSSERNKVIERRVYHAIKANTLVTGLGGANNKSGTVVVKVSEGVAIPSAGKIYRHEGNNYQVVAAGLLSCGLGEVSTRHLSVREAARLQTIPESFKFEGIVSDNQAYKIIGNGWTIKVIAQLLKGLKC